MNVSMDVLLPEILIFRVFTSMCTYLCVCIFTCLHYTCVCGSKWVSPYYISHFCAWSSERAPYAVAPYMYAV